MTKSETPQNPVALENRDRTDDGRHFSPSAARNRDPIREVLEKVLPKSGIALEIGSGTGEHVICFAKALPGLLWQPSDPDPTSRASIAAWIAAEGLANVRAPVAIDTRQAIWGVEDEAPFAAMVSLNMIHIAPWGSALGLLAGAGRLLRPDGILYLYGPFMRAGAHTAPSNAAFDADLKRRDPSWGVRDIDDLVGEAAPYGLELREVTEMPANNLSLVFVRTAGYGRARHKGRDEMRLWSLSSILFAVAATIALPAAAESPPPGSYQGTCTKYQGSEASRRTRQESHRHLPEEERQAGRRGADASLRGRHQQ